MGLDHELRRISRVSAEILEEWNRLSLKERTKEIENNHVYRVWAEDIEDADCRRRFRDIMEFMSPVKMEREVFDADGFRKDYGVGEDSNWGFTGFGLGKTRIRITGPKGERRVELDNVEMDKYRMYVEKDAYVFEAETLITWRKEYGLDTFIREKIFEERMACWKNEHGWEIIPDADTIAGMHVGNCEYAHVSRDVGIKILEYLQGEGSNVWSQGDTGTLAGKDIFYWNYY